MQDLQNYRYYDPSPQLTPEPWWKRKRTWQLTGLIILGLLVLALAMTAALNALKNGQLAKQDVELMQQAHTLESRLGARCDEGDTACLQLARADSARSLGLLEACNELSGENFEACVSLIAIDKLDPQVCNVLSGEARSECADTPYLLKATASTDLSLCAQIMSMGSRAACETQVRGAVIAAGECASVGLDQALCDSAQRLAEAIATGESTACGALNENDEYVCLKGQGEADADQDGLVALDETVFGTSDGVADADADGLTDGDEVHVYATDPTLTDTDGDGFSDGTEVSGGYDPLK